MAISAEYLNLSQSDHLNGPSQYALLQRLIGDGTVYIPQALTAPQFATLNALLHRLVPHTETNHETSPDHLTSRLGRDLTSKNPASLAPRFRASRLGLDELDTLARTHTRYAFIELPPELQDAMLDLIAAGDLTTEKLNLGRWLEDLRSTTAPRLHIPPPIDRLY